MKDHEWSNDPLCPYCGHKAQDAWEWGADTESGTHECGNCEKEYVWRMHIMVRYSTNEITP